MGEKGNLDAGAPGLSDLASEAVGIATETAKGVGVGVATARVERRLEGDEDEGSSSATT